ncbi:MAG: Ig-like domain-containing protein [Chitinophagaceae bacterium]|nr:Ig-like domain-containing protein [Chitinophagaceae bacterium]
MKPNQINNISSLLLLLIFISCSKGKGSGDDTPPVRMNLVSWSVNNVSGKTDYDNVPVLPEMRFRFSAPVKRSSVTNAFSLSEVSASSVAMNVSYADADSTVIIKPAASFGFLKKYKLTLTRLLESTAGRTLENAITIDLRTQLDSSRKFPQLTDDQLLTKVQAQTFKYFWDFAHPVSGLARERSNGSDNVTASGGSGFGIMAILVGIERGFITRAQGLTRLQTIVNFLKNTTVKHKGAFPHWIDGNTGATLPFSTKDNGADLVETSYLIMGLLCARQYFGDADPTETMLRNNINEIWQNVEWDWFRRGGQQVLYWHWSPQYEWDMNLPISGWNECLITYVLAASSPTHSIPASVYTNGWTRNGAFVNGGIYNGYRLPLGPAFGGPLFLSHYSFLGINPNGLTDAYANYADQTRNHTLINYSHCLNNPGSFAGYSDSIWGLTASDIPAGYTASSPTNDLGVIAPTAAISSLPFTPAQSMAALHFFYYVLGDKLWKDYGFIDAFSLNKTGMPVRTWQSTRDQSSS